MENIIAIGHGTFVNSLMFFDEYMHWHHCFASRIAKQTNYAMNK